MPSAIVTLKKGKTKSYRDEIHASVKSALIETFKLPEDDYVGISNQVDPEDWYFDENFWGIPRSDDIIFIDMSWNNRTAELKNRLFEKIADNLEAAPGMKRTDIIIVVKETAPANWWVHGRTTNPETGLDSRIVDPPAGSFGHS